MNDEDLNISSGNGIYIGPNVNGGTLYLSDIKSYENQGSGIHIDPRADAKLNNIETFDNGKDGLTISALLRN
ncbi:hypothetical protein AB4182_08540, partial [Vibrio splendidus]